MTLTHGTLVVDLAGAFNTETQVTTRLDGDLNRLIQAKDTGGHWGRVLGRFRLLALETLGTRGKVVELAFRTGPVALLHISFFI